MDDSAKNINDIAVGLLQQQQQQQQQRKNDGHPSSSATPPSATAASASSLLHRHNQPPLMSALQTRPPPPPPPHPSSYQSQPQHSMGHHPFGFAGGATDFGSMNPSPSQPSSSSTEEKPPLLAPSRLNPDHPPQRQSSQFPLPPLLPQHLQLLAAGGKNPLETLIRQRKDTMSDFMMGNPAMLMGLENGSDPEVALSLHQMRMQAMQVMQAQREQQLQQLQRIEHLQQLQQLQQPQQQQQHQQHQQQQQRQEDQERKATATNRRDSDTLNSDGDSFRSDSVSPPHLKMTDQQQAMMHRLQRKVSAMIANPSSSAAAATVGTTTGGHGSDDDEDNKELVIDDSPQTTPPPPPHSSTAPDAPQHSTPKDENAGETPPEPEAAPADAAVTDSEVQSHHRQLIQPKREHGVEHPSPSSSSHPEPAAAPSQSTPLDAMKDPSVSPFPLPGRPSTTALENGAAGLSELRKTYLERLLLSTNPEEMVAKTAAEASGPSKATPPPPPPSAPHFSRTLFPPQGPSEPAAGGPVAAAASAGFVPPPPHGLFPIPGMGMPDFHRSAMDDEKRYLAFRESVLSQNVKGHNRGRKREASAAAGAPPSLTSPVSPGNLAKMLRLQNEMQQQRLSLGDGGNVSLAAANAAAAAAAPDGLKDGKDAAYWERRKKNNEAAKKSRDARRLKEQEVSIRAQYLERENYKLNFQVFVLEAKIHALENPNSATAVANAKAAVKAAEEIAAATAAANPTLPPSTD